MPALTIPSPTNTLPLTRSTSPTDVSGSPSRSQSPDHPPVSPLTPTTSAARLAPLEPPKPQEHHVLSPPLATFIPQPRALPISESDNPDAIALRSAISLLQLQREKSKRDLKALEELKLAAVSDPQGFARALQAQESQSSRSQGDVLAPTLSGLGELTGGGEPATGRKDSAGTDVPPLEKEATTKFRSIPQPQNVVRCPPVNWAKYHIVGEPLDKMHEEQKKYPGSSEPPRTHQGTRAPPHAVAAPYSPFIDGISDPKRSQQLQPPSRTTKKSPS